MIDRSRAIIRSQWQFKPYRVPPHGVPLRAAGLASDYELMVLERNGDRRAFSMREMAYHHVAQGELAGEPYLVTF